MSRLSWPIFNPKRMHRMSLETACRGAKHENRAPRGGYFDFLDLPFRFKFTLQNVSEIPRRFSVYLTNVPWCQFIFASFQDVLCGMHPGPPPSIRSRFLWRSWGNTNHTELNCLAQKCSPSFLVSWLSVRVCNGEEINKHVGLITDGDGSSRRDLCNIICFKGSFHLGGFENRDMLERFWLVEMLWSYWAWLE